jgi:hypothetical protein
VIHEIMRSGAAPLLFIIGRFVYGTTEGFSSISRQKLQQQRAPGDITTKRNTLMRNNVRTETGDKYK